MTFVDLFSAFVEKNYAVQQTERYFVALLAVSDENRTFRASYVCMQHVVCTRKIYS